jgi:YfiH family protein
VFYKDSENVYRARPLDAFDWLVHGFGTRLSKDFGKCPNIATLHQVHSDSIIAAEGRSGCLGEGDGLVENTPGVSVAVKTADCIPVLIVDPRNRAVAAVHAGWRGTVRNIAARAVAEVHSKFSSHAKDLHVAIGPGIGKCCYEVGPAVGQQFRDYDTTLSDITHAVHLDLAELNRRQLSEAGVPAAQIYTALLCTRCHSEFHSYRRDKQDAGRMLSMVGIK